MALELFTTPSKKPESLYKNQGIEANSHEKEIAADSSIFKQTLTISIRLCVQI
jgi:hypothetical protein